MNDTLSPTLLPKVTPEQVPALALAMAHSGLALMLYGSPGIGKTSLVQALGRDPHLRAWAETQSGMKLDTLPVVTLSAPELNVEDLLGVPTVAEIVRARADGSFSRRQVTKWATPALLDPERPFVLFIDEPNRCEPSVRNALFQLITGRTTSAGFALPKGSLVCMAGNRLEDRAGVRTLDTAFNNRCVHVELEVDAESWLVWAAAQDGFSPLVRAFISAHPEYLNRFDPASTLPQQPTPRTWEALARALQSGAANPTILAHGLLGPEPGRIFSAFAANAKILPSHEELMRDPEGIVLPKAGELDRAWILSTHLVDHLVKDAKGQQDHLGRAVATVLGRLAAEGFEEVAVFTLRRTWRRIDAERDKSAPLPMHKHFFQAMPVLATLPAFQQLAAALDQVGAA